MAYRMAPVLVTLNYLKGHSPVAGFLSALRRTFVAFCAAFYQISADSVLALSLSDSWAYRYMWPIEWHQTVA